MTFTYHKRVTFVLWPSLFHLPSKKTSHLSVYYVCTLLILGILHFPCFANPLAGNTPLESQSVRTKLRTNSSQFSGIPPVRVLLTSRPVNILSMHIDGPYDVLTPDKELLLHSNQSFRGSIKTGNLFFDMGNHHFQEKVIEIVPTSQPSLWINDHLYRGSLRVIRTSANRLRAVNYINIEDYLASVLNGEMPDSFPQAARSAQAIAARTYALYQAKTFGKHSTYDLRSGTGSQVYQGVQYRNAKGKRIAVENRSSRQIIDRTRGVVCTHRGKLFCTYYSSICGGRTTNGKAIFKDAATPLMSVPCDWCVGSKYYRWKSSVKRNTVERQLQKYFTQKNRSFDQLKEVTLQKATRRGNIPLVRVSTTHSSMELSSYVFRLRVSPKKIRSPYFLVQDQGTHFAFSGRGWGHGVGLCQWGARGQALAGRSATHILMHYYPHSELITVK